MKLHTNISSPAALTLLSLSLLLLAGCSTGHSGDSHDNSDGHHGDAIKKGHEDENEDHGHGGEDGDHHDTTAGKPGQAANVDRTVQVDMTDSMKFIPASIEVSAGETIRFEVKNSGKLIHEFVIGSNDEITEHHKLMMKFPGMEHDEPNSVSLETDASGEVIWHFTNAGKFDFACLQPGHYEAGMKGSFDVSN